MTSDFDVNLNSAPTDLSANSPEDSAADSPPLESRVETFSYAQQPKIRVYNSYITIPLQHLTPCDSVFRVGVDNTAVTRFNPNSIEFDKSINWNCPEFNSTILSSIEDIPIQCIRADSISSLLSGSLAQYFKNVKLRALDSESFRQEYSSAINTLALLGREKPRVEREWRLTGGLPGSAIRRFFTAVIHGWTNTDRVGDTLNPASAVSLAGRIFPHPFRAYVGSLSENNIRNRLINVYEIRHQKEETHFCLSFFSRYRDSLSRKFTGHIYHVWISMPAPGVSELFESTVPIGADPTIGSGEHSNPHASCYPYIYGGLPLLFRQIQLRALGVDLKTEKVTVSNGKVTISIPWVEIENRLGRLGITSPPFLASRWGLTVSAANSFVIQSSLFHAGNFGLNLTNAEAEAKFQNFQPMNTLRRVLTFKWCGGYPLGSMPNGIGKDFLADFITKDDVLSTMLQKAQLAEWKKNISAALSTPGLTYKGLIKVLAEPEFRSNLPV